ncbi:hypothetical protein D1007_31824 [Hordeum vulgare]|nr:hypothetical protein D1007_31824 [Hordeum vulgare]
MDRAPPPGAPRDAVGQRWLAVFAFQAALSVAASVIHLAVSPSRRHPSLGVPPAFLLALHPLLSCAATGLLALAFLISASPHPGPPPVPKLALAASLSRFGRCALRGRRRVSGPRGRRMGCRRWAGIPRRCVGRGVRRSLLWPWEVVAPVPRRTGLEFILPRLRLISQQRFAMQMTIVLKSWEGCYLTLLSYLWLELLRPMFYGLKMGLLPSIKRALKMSLQVFLVSIVLILILPRQFRMGGSIGSQIITQIAIFIVTTCVSFCWEISHHFVQVVHTRRCSFTPPQSSAAAETNPTDCILETLELSNPRSLLQYLAFQDLCAVSECNIEPWRRGAFFEESGETYKRIVTACLKPLEDFTSKIAEALEGFTSEKPELLLQQSKLYGAFSDSQICSWCARTLATLTARSRQEDRYGVAQLTGCNAAVMSTLLSALVAVEACLGKKTNPQPAHSLGPASIRWGNFSTARKGNATAIASTQRGGLHTKAYSMADVFRTSIYQIVSAFLDDMRANAKASSLEKNWISEGRKPIYGSRDVLVQKLSLFIEYRAV